MGEHKSAMLLVSTGIIVLLFICMLLFFGGLSSIDRAEDAVNKKWVKIFQKSQDINAHIYDLTIIAKSTKVAPENINSRFENIKQTAETNGKLFATANSPEKVLTLVQNADLLVKEYKGIDFTPENYPALEEKVTYLTQYYILLDKEKELRLLIGEYRDYLEYHNSLLNTFPISLSVSNKTELVSHFDREY